MEVSRALKMTNKHLKSYLVWLWLWWLAEWLTCELPVIIKMYFYRFVIGWKSLPFLSFCHGNIKIKTSIIIIEHNWDSHYIHSFIFLILLFSRFISKLLLLFCNFFRDCFRIKIDHYVQLYIYFVYICLSFAAPFFFFHWNHFFCWFYFRFLIFIKSKNINNTIVSSRWSPSQSQTKRQLLCCVCSIHLWRCCWEFVHQPYIPFARGQVRVSFETFLCLEVLEGSPPLPSINFLHEHTGLAGWSKGYVSFLIGCTLLSIPIPLRRKHKYFIKFSWKLN